MKKIISLMVVVLMIFATLSVSAIAQVDTSIDLQMVEGASIRLNEKNGIRFYAEVDTDKVQALRDAGYKVELGTLIAPKDLLKESNNSYKELTFDVDTSRYVNVKFEAKNYYQEESFTGIVGSIVNIQEKANTYSYDNGNKARPFVGRAYAIVTDSEGNQTISYAQHYNANFNNNSRSLYQLAKAFKADNYAGMDLTTEQLQKIEDWIDCEFWTGRY